ncbi:MAG TPA: S53 family peptidase, partial [Gaiellaceae bacterium]|nr:S53 family peptidase [Gaiellaceae bacterium]
VAFCAALVLVAGAAAHPFDVGPDHGWGGPPRGGPGHGRGAWFSDVCDAVVLGDAACGALVVTDANGDPLASSSPPATAYGPAQFHGAYNLPTTSSASTAPTIAIVDAYDDPNAEADLGVYDTQYKLPACTTANGCFRKVSQTGTTRYPRSNSGWALEISLDIETAHQICQNCKILLVEASSSSMSNLGASVNEAVKLGATVVSNSYGGGESSADTSYDSAYFNHPGVAITVSSGDSGYGVEYPAASRYVTAVGGTTLNLGSGNTYGSESAWSSGGSGCSRYDAKQSWQTDAGCSRRTVADVSADADPNTGAAVYDSVPYSGQSGWFQVGGTSLASPLIAGVYALAGNAASVTYGSYPYSHTSSLHDVTSGSNGSCSGSYLCTAGSGYDGPTGLGSPNGVGGF